MSNPITSKTTGTANTDTPLDASLAELVTLSKELLNCFDDDGNIVTDRIAKLSETETDSETDAKTCETFEDARARILDRLESRGVYDGSLLDLEEYTDAFLSETYSLAASLEHWRGRCESLERQCWQMEFSRYERSVLDACDTIFESVSALTSLLGQGDNDGAGTAFVPASKWEWQGQTIDINACATRIVKLMEMVHNAVA